MSRKREKKARSFSWNGAQKSAEKLVIAKSGTPSLVERLDDLVNAGHRTGDRLAEALAPGRDQSRIFGEFLAELGRRLGIGPAAVQRLVPAVEVDILDELQPRRVVGDLPDQEGVGIPAVEDVADVEDDGGRRPP